METVLACELYVMYVYVIQVKGRYSLESVIDFPPKIMRISDDELIWRRKQLERYLHCCMLQ